MNNLTGYGPSNHPNRRNIFNSDHDDFELWEVKFMAHLRLSKLDAVLKQEPDVSTQAAYDEKNADIFSTLVMCLDDKALSLIMRDAKDDGKKSLQILREHHLGTSKPRVISLYCELTTLKMAGDESVVEYLIRAETEASRLKKANETVSDSLLIAMVIKGLPDRYRSFNTVISQKDNDDLHFQKFKMAVCTYEENEKARETHCSTDKDTVLNVGHDSNSIQCYPCGTKGHKSYQCNKSQSYKNSKKYSSRRLCENCRSSSHNTIDYRKKTTASKHIKENRERDGDNSDNFIFKVSVANSASKINENKKDFLIDCGATTHIVCDRNKFVKIDSTFDNKNHSIEQADSSRQHGVAVCRGDSEGGYGINTQVEKSKNMTIVKFMVCDLNQLF